MQRLAWAPGGVEGPPKAWWAQEGGHPEAQAEVMLCQKGELRVRKVWKAWVDSVDRGGWKMSTSLSTSSDTSRATICRMSCRGAGAQGQGCRVGGVGSGAG